MAHFQFQIEINKMEKMNECYRKNVKELYQTYQDLEKIISALQQEKVWQGESFDAFITKYEIIKNEFLLLMNQMIILENYTNHLINESKNFIQERDQLFL